MNKYKLEAAIFYSKLTSDRDHLVKSSEIERQGTLDRYAEDGWRLVSTDAAGFGSAMYFYLYFERDVDPNH